jgi:ATP-binding cassette subfamily B protein
MEHGRIIERGTHESLLRAEGRYAQMWRMQAREPERVAAAEAEDA